MLKMSCYYEFRFINDAIAFDTRNTWMLRKKLRACDKALLLDPNIASKIKWKMKEKVSHCFDYISWSLKAIQGCR